ncbi:MAG: hypothetical protein E4G95_01300 [Bacteroidia bacterium]|nr:MAG: hypothetical protein E4G95_01300 [Bacteroidia bacterium]
MKRIMSLKNNMGKDYRVDLKAYLDNKMSEEQRNSFERMMESDPFLREAVEGMSGIGRDEAESDLNELASTINRKTSIKRLTLWYRISAAVAVLLIVSSVFLVRELRNPPVVASGESRNEEAMKQGEDPAIPLNQDDIVSERKKAEEETQISGKTERAEKSESIAEEQLAVITRETEVEKVAGQNIMGITEGAKGKAVADMNEAIMVDEEIPEARVSSAVKRVQAAQAELVATGGNLIRGTVISSDDNLPLPGSRVIVRGTNMGAVADYNGNFEIRADSAQVLVASFLGMQSREIAVTGNDIGSIILDPDMAALEEVVVVGYGVQGRVAGVSTGSETIVEFDKDQPVYNTAQPEGGMTQFRDYAEMNLVFPADYSISDREVVRLKFSVSSLGELYDFEIIKSPGDEFSNEAIRLIREGPAWQPATSDRQAVTGTVRLRILFRKR